MRLVPCLSILAVAAAASGCVTPGSTGPAAEALMESRSASSVTGSVSLQDTPAGLRLRGEIRGLKAGAEHGFHIHEKGDCSAADASSAGGHFNPGATAHGRAGSGTHHAGDMPNLKADARGIAKVDQVVAGVTLAAGPASAAGRSLVVHRDPDDYASQPAGNSGPRVACGVITPAR